MLLIANHYNYEKCQKIKVKFAKQVATIHLCFILLYFENKTQREVFFQNFTLSSNERKKKKRKRLLVDFIDVWKVNVFQDVISKQKITTDGKKYTYVRHPIRFLIHEFRI
jgi:hypothetical protein